MCEADVLRALTCFHGSPYPYWRWLAVPNVSHGWLQYEADLVVVSNAGWAQEIEVKVSASDLKADRHKSKHRGHDVEQPWRSGYIDKRMKKFWYAVPENLADIAVSPGVIVDGAGIIVVGGNTTYRIVREAAIRKEARRCTDRDVIKLMRLGTMRFWSKFAKLSDHWGTA